MRKMKKTVSIFAFMLCLCVVWTLTACGGSPADTAESQSPAAAAETADTTVGENSAAASEDLKIAAIMKNRSNPYYHTMEEGFVRAGEDFGVIVEGFAMESEADLDKELQLCTDLLNKDYDGMVLIPINGAAFGPFVKMANDKGLPIVNIDTQLTQDSLDEVGATYVTYVGSDDYSAGVMAAQELAKALNNEGELAVIEGTPGSSTADNRKLGFEEEIARINADGGKLQIVASQPANWDTNEAYDVFQNVIQGNPNLAGVFACNDLMAVGVINAADAAGKLEQLKIISIDMIPDAQELIQQGKLMASISQAPDMMAYIGVEKLIDFINGKAVDAEYRTESIVYYKDDIS